MYQSPGGTGDNISVGGERNIHYLNLGFASEYFSFIYKNKSDDLIMDVMLI